MAEHGRIQNDEIKKKKKYDKLGWATYIAFTEPQKKKGGVSISCDPWYVVWQSIITIPDNSVPLLTPQTLLNIFGMKDSIHS